jgi:hypothetical protein
MPTLSLLLHLMYIFISLGCPFVKTVGIEPTNGQAHTSPGADTGKQSPMPRSLSSLTLRPQNPFHLTYNKGP